MEIFNEKKQNFVLKQTFKVAVRFVYFDCKKELKEKSLMKHSVFLWFIANICISGIFLLNKKTVYLPFSIYERISISGDVILYSKYKRFSLTYLQYKDIIKICSFFYYNYGTVIKYLKKYSINIKKNFSYLETVECYENATDIDQCKFIYSRYKILKFSLKVKIFISFFIVFNIQI